MPAGIELYDPSGNLIFGGSDRMARYVGSVDLPVNASGNVYVPEFTQQGVQPFLFVVTATDGDSAYVYTNGAYLYWNYEASVNAVYVPCTVYYGVY